MARMLLVAVRIQGAILLVGVLQILQLHFTGNYLLCRLQIHLSNLMSPFAALTSSLQAHIADAHHAHH